MQDGNLQILFCTDWLSLWMKLLDISHCDNLILFISSLY
ncbi:unnamed protein product [Musa acuminata subsp. malaccensis]|uniref:(wild Malaysian banana) hypothetical protein n=1 Tax=Musa acuminata subsp. malaccensis TaxID=214687 RepID=A0A804KP75_MUSAM|nr:unnamed protein product [Musa acuminata subsp. malaccensis]